MPKNLHKFLIIKIHHKLVAKRDVQLIGKLTSSLFIQILLNVLKIL